MITACIILATAVGLLLPYCAWLYRENGRTHDAWQRVSEERDNLALSLGQRNLGTRDYYLGGVLYQTHSRIAGMPC
jgi:hypothetical protein